MRSLDRSTRWRRWLVVPLGVAAAFVLQDVAVSWLWGTPARAWGLVPLSSMRLASMFALGIVLVLATVVCARGLPRTAQGRTFALAALTLALFTGNGRYVGSNDVAATRLIPFVLGREGRPCFENSPQIPIDRRQLPYWFVPAGEHVVSRYPVTSGVLALPVYAPALIGAYDPARERVHELERIAAAVLSVLGVWIVLAIARRVLSEGAAVAAAGVYAFGTNVATVTSKALWQHTGGAFGFALALAGLLLARGRIGPGLLAGVGLGLAVAARSTNALPAAWVWLALGVARGRLSLLLSALAALLPVAAQAAYASYYFGSPLGHGYGAEAVDGWNGNWLAGIAGLLVSPSRGLLVYAPCLAFAAVALAVPSAQRDPAQPPAELDPRVTRLLLLAIASVVLVMGKWWCWWGGGSPADRMTADIAPLWGLGLVLAWRRFGGEARLRKPFFASCIYACAIHALIVFVRPSGFVIEHFVRVLHGPWSPQAFAPVSYALGLL